MLLPSLLSFAVRPFSPSLSLSSVLFLQSVELNLNDTLTEIPLSDLILFVSPFQRAGDMSGSCCAVSETGTGESSVVEYLKTPIPTKQFPRGALAYLRFIITDNSLTH